MASAIAPDAPPGRGNEGAEPGGRARPARLAGPLLVLLGLSLLAGALLASDIARAQAPPSEAIPSAPAPAIPSAVAQFTTEVVNREPTDQVTFVSNDIRKIFFFSDLRGLTGQTVTHRWIYRGEVTAEVAFEVGGPRWRVWSSKDLIEDWVGDWTVEIVRGDGEVLAAETFTYSAPGA